MDRKIAIIGLGYVGLQTAMAFGLQKPIIGFDNNNQRITELKEGNDCHQDFLPDQIKNRHITFTNNSADISDADFYIVAVPTPVKKNNEPDFSCLIAASNLIAKYLKKGDIVVYESTVYPGATEEICLPLLTQGSQLKYGEDFSIGYSPERINPGDLEHTFSNTTKIVSGSDERTLDIIADVYKLVVKAGVFRASNIKTAEASKIVENIQRDTNIALVNELSQLFHNLNIDTEEVIRAAQTKWNFQVFHPGLVGGHCISVDPYYLLYKANELGAPLKLINAARQVNEQMSSFVVKEAIKVIVKQKLVDREPKVAILGITFKENYDDIRNSKVVNMGKELESYGVKVFYNDPVADKKVVFDEYHIKLCDWNEIPKVAVIIIAVAHDQYKKIGEHEYIAKIEKNGLLMDLKSIMDPKKFESQDIAIWKL